MRYNEKHLDCIVKYDYRGIIREDGYIGGISINNLINNVFELIEEQQDIDIQEIQKIEKYCNIIENTENEKVLFRMIQNNANKIDELVEAVKQLDKKINTKYCENCGVELNKENTALPNMCCECKYGIDE